MRLCWGYVTHKQSNFHFRTTGPSFPKAIYHFSTQSINQPDTHFRNEAASHNSPSKRILTPYSTIVAWRTTTGCVGLHAPSQDRHGKRQTALRWRSTCNFLYKCMHVCKDTRAANYRELLISARQWGRAHVLVDAFLRLPFTRERCRTQIPIINSTDLSLAVCTRPIR